MFTRRDELALRFTGANILLRIKDGEVAADDLFRLVAFDAACTGIPRGHASGRIQHEDRIVSNGFDEQLENRLVLTKPLIAAAAGADFRSHIERKNDDPFDPPLIGVHRLINEIEEMFLAVHDH